MEQAAEIAPCGGPVISEDDPVVSLALSGIRPALIIAQTGMPPTMVSARLTAARRAGMAIPDFTRYPSQTAGLRGEKLSPDDLARVERKTEARGTTFPDRERAFDPHPDCPGVLISDQVGDTMTPGPCAWCGGRILEGTRICRMEREVGGQRQVTRFCAACIAARGSVKSDNGGIEERRKLKVSPCQH